MTRLSADPARAIPHRPPILCIDRILDVDAEHAVTERVVVPGDHMDGDKAWELAIVEALAQTAAVLDAFQEHKEGPRARHGMLVGIRRFRMGRRVGAGERIVFRVELVRRISPLTIMRCEAKVGEDVIASGEMKFYVEIGE